MSQCKYWNNSRHMGSKQMPQSDSRVNGRTKEWEQKRRLLRTSKLRQRQFWEGALMASNVHLTEEKNGRCVRPPAFILCCWGRPCSCHHGGCIGTQLQHGLKTNSTPRARQAGSPQLELLRWGDTIVNVDIGVYNMLHCTPTGPVFPPREQPLPFTHVFVCHWMPCSFVTQLWFAKLFHAKHLFSPLEY